MSTSNLPEGPTAEGTDPPAAALQSDRGKTVIAENVVARVADMAAREIPGVHSLAGGVGSRLRRLAPGMGEANRAAAVEVGEKEAIVALDLVVEYGVSIPQLAEAVRRNVIERVEYTTGLIVKEVSIEVTDLHFPDGDRDAEPTAPRVQ
ncbi:MAG: hypothetical protein QOD86_1251 [Miltoncostaeaceae bacterium]|jgi:uncharacterized alkaline shock family protein YloU|nr:hypothetical protein [Miltoncostaeaceae bacterium]